ncbi:hypothetical protein ACP5PY_26875 [Photobacterium leiognathi subsp. mandapamensis]
MQKKQLPHVVDAKKRAKEKEQILLSFLSTERFIDLANLKLLLDINANTNAYSFLRKMIKLGYIIKHKYDGNIVNVSVWGITQIGLLTVSFSDNLKNVFEPSKLNFTNINHRLMIQRTRIYLEIKKGWTGWIDSREMNKKNRPSALVTSPKNVVFALEAEWQLKTPLRYRSIIKNHIQAIEEKKWAHVIFIVNDENARQHLNHRLKNMKYIQKSEQRFPYERYQKYISIFTIDEMQKIRHD